MHVGYVQPRNPSVGSKRSRSTNLSLKPCPVNHGTRFCDRNTRCSRMSIAQASSGLVNSNNRMDVVKKSRKERRLLKRQDQHQLPSPGTLMLLDQVPANTSRQQQTSSYYQPRTMVILVTPGRAHDPVGAIGVNWENQSSPRPGTPGVTATPPTQPKPLTPTTMWMGFCDGCGSSPCGLPVTRKNMLWVVRLRSNDTRTSTTWGHGRHHSSTKPTPR